MGTSTISLPPAAYDWSSITLVIFGPLLQADTLSPLSLSHLNTPVVARTPHRRGTHQTQAPSGDLWVTQLALCCLAACWRADAKPAHRGHHHHHHFLSFLSDVKCPSIHLLTSRQML